MSNYNSLCQTLLFCVNLYSVKPAGLIGIFLGEHRILTALALAVGVLIWSTGIYLTQEES